MSIFRDDCIFHGQLLADFAKQFPAKPIDPPFPAVTSKPTSDNSAHEAQDVAAIPFINSYSKDEE